MSIEALSAVFKAGGLPSGVKFVLVALANCADAAGRCWPSIDHIVSVTCQDRKTVLASIQSLLADGWMRDTGERRGRTRQIKVYELELDRATRQPDLFREERARQPTEVEAPAKRTENGTLPTARTVPETEQFQKRNSTVFPRKESQKRDTEPAVNLELEEEEDAAGARGRAATTCPELAGLEPIPAYLDRSVLAEFVRHRQVLRRPLSLSGWLQIRKRLDELHTAGHDANESLRQTMAAGLSIPFEPRAAAEQAIATAGNGSRAPPKSAIDRVMAGIQQLDDRGAFD